MPKNKLKIVFFGSSKRAIPVLDRLCLQGFVPQIIVTADSPEVDNWVNSKDKDLFKVLKPKKLDKDFVALLKAEKPDLGILASYGKMLPKGLLEIFPKGILNIHPSLLPKYRGPSPEQAAILNGDKITGSTIMLLKNEMDAGPILIQKELEISESDTLLTLSSKLFELGAELLAEVLPQWIWSKITPKEQNHKNAIYTKLIRKEDGKINWSRPAVEIERMARAYNPWPGAYAAYGNSILIIKKAEVIEDEPIAKKSGDTFNADGYPAVKCGEDSLKLFILQPAGKKEMSGADFLKGHRDFVGNNLF